MLFRSVFEPDEWHRRATRDGSFLAFIPELTVPAGLVGGFEQEPGAVELVSMFVRPRARGHRVGEALIDAIVTWAQDRNATSVHLWVTEINKPAIRLYERCGFTVTAECQPLPSNPQLGEFGMTRPLLTRTRTPPAPPAAAPAAGWRTGPGPQPRPRR